MIDQNDPRLTAYVLGELSHTEMMEIDQAIFLSPELADVVEEIRGTVGMLDEAYASEEKLSLSDEQRVTLKGKPAATSNSSRRWFAVAAAVGLLVFLGGVINSDYFTGGSQQLSESIAANSPEETAARLPEVVYRTETVTRQVPVQRTRTETRTRTVPCTKIRTESREVTLADGTTVTKELEVPYTENVTQTYTVQVPYTENTVQAFQVEVPYTADGQRIAKADYGKFGISPGLIGRPAEFISGGEVPIIGLEGSTRSELADMRTGREATPYGGGLVTASDFDGLKELVQQTVESEAWLDTGKQEIQPFPANLSLLVQNSQVVEPEFDPEEAEGQMRDHSILTDSFSSFDRRPIQQGGQGKGGEAATAMSGGMKFSGRIHIDAAGRVDEVRNLSERDLKDVLESSFELVENETRSSSELVLREASGLRSGADRDMDEIQKKLAERSKALVQAEQALEDGKQRASEEESSLVDMAGDITDEIAASKMKLLEAKAKSELIRTKVGTGHPDYEAAIAQTRLIERELEKNEREAEASSVKVQIERVHTSLKQVLVSFKKVDELKKSGSTDDRKKALAALGAKLAEMELAAEKIKQLVGNGHPEFMAAKQQIETIKQYIDGLKNELAKEKQALDADVAAKPKSWKRVKAIPNTTRLMVGDKEELDLNGMQVNAQVDGFRARVLVDYFYYNDRERQLEGNFKLRLPDDASLYYFAFGESAYSMSPEGKLAAEEFLSDGTQFVSLAAQDVKRARKGQWDNVKESRMVPKEKAAHAFRETVRRRVDPALVEWSGAGVFNAKVFPLAPKKLHRIVVGYDVNLKRSKDGLKFELSLPEQTGECRVELNVQNVEGVSYSVTPEADPIPTEVEGKLQKRFVFNNDKEQLSKIELAVTGANNLLLSNTTLPLSPLGGSAKPGRESGDKASNEKANDQSGKEVHPPRESSSQASDLSRPSQREGDGARFWTMQVTPDLPADDAKANSRAIFMVDTSLSSSPEKFSVWLNMLESTLNNNRDSLKEFDVLFFNVDSHFWKNKYVANTAVNVAELKMTLENLALEGATDLYGAIQSVAGADWTGDANNRPDLFLLSDGAATWGETDLRLINQLLQQPKLGSLFAYQTGLSGTAISGLRFLAGQSGGAVFSVATEDEIKIASTAHRKRPWQLKSIAAEGASDILTAGRVQWVYPGQTITVVGRGNVKESIELQFQQGNESKTVTLTPTAIQSELASRMYGHVAVGQLESLGSQVFDVSAAYARHFRITGQTCSLLMLESEEDYQRFDIKPQEDLFVVKAKATSKLVAETLEKFSEQLIDPKAKLQAWLKRLESMPGMQFKMPTALKLAMDDIKVEAISEPMDCSLTLKDGLSESYLKTIGEEKLDYERIAAEASRRAGSSAGDAIKVYSSLVERSPGDIIVARDVAFTAMEMDRPAQAFHLLRRVARARPFQGNIYPAIGQCLAQMGKADMAIVYYEIAMNGTFQRQGGEFKQIVAAEYIHLLRQIVSGKLESSVKDFAAARLETLGKHLPFGTADVVVTMMWNQDQTDVDMHVVEPSGEECSYEHKKTRSGGQITTDITTGFGPEMYYNANAPRGKYQLKAKFFGSGQNRTSTRNKVYMTIIRGFGTDEETMTRRTIQLDKVGEKVPVMTFGIDP